MDAYLHHLHIFLDDLTLVGNVVGYVDLEHGLAFALVNAQAWRRNRLFVERLRWTVTFVERLHAVMRGQNAGRTVQHPLPFSDPEDQQARGNRSSESGSS